MDSYVAYIDESGNHDLVTEKDGASRYFVVLAILLPQSEAAALEAEVEIVRAKYFGAGEMKSSNVKDERRKRILDDLALLNFKFYAVAVDKERIDKDSGLGYKRSFIKFANGKLYSALFQNLMDVAVFADAHGSPDFAKSFIDYMEENHKQDLFSNGKVQMVDSQMHVLVQLADFLVGTVAKLYEKKSTPLLRKDFLSFLGAKRIRIDEWPPQYELRGALNNSTSEMDEKVRFISLNAAGRFLQDHAEQIDTENRIQQAALGFMLFRATFASDTDYIPTDEIVEHLNTQGFQEVNKHYLRSNVIAKLRDKDVIIASSSRGYKIPTSYSDLCGFAELVDGIASPLLARLKRAHGIFELGSVGKIKILDEPRFKRLRLMLSHLDEVPI